MTRLGVRSLLLVPLLWLSIGLPAVADDGRYEAVRDWLEASVPDFMQQAKLPGMSVAVVADGETIYAAGFGSRDRERNLPATPDTLYGIGSITKSFVAIGILQLVEAGKLSLDDPVSKHVPFELGLEGQPITLHHLLTHSLGVPSLASSTVMISRGLGIDTGVPLGSGEDFYRFVNGAKGEEVAPPGERFFYHNAAWRILGDVIQRVSGMPFHVYVEERILDPLGMRRSGLDLSDFEADADHIVPYLRGPDGEHDPSRFPYPNPAENPGFSFLSAAGGIFSSVSEMTRYLELHLEQGRNLDRPFLEPASFAKMQRAHIVDAGEGHYGDEGYGYGLRIVPDFLGHTIVRHGGSIAVSTAHLAFVPDLDAGVVMMGNGSGVPYDTIADGVFALLLGETPEEVVPALRIRRRMRELTGTYEVYRGLERLDVVQRGGLLYLETTSPFAPGEPSRTPLIPEDPSLESTRFFVLSNGLRSPVEMQVTPEGGVDLYLGRYVYHRTD